MLFRSEDDVYADLISRYKLKKLNNGKHVLCGFMKFDDQFNAEEAEAKGILLQPATGDIRTVCIPLDLVKYFFTLPGITYFEPDSTMNQL